MPLSKKDLKRIRRLGFNYDFFAFSKDGWQQSKNQDGRCVFNNGKQCSICKNRPEGCKLYPIIYNDDRNCATLDEDCPHRDEFKIPKTDIVTLRFLIRKLEDERRRIEGKL